jgi:hypothetical protein
MIISPKQFISKLVQNRIIDQTEGDKIEIDALNKNISIFDYLLKYTSIKKESVLRVQAEFMNVPFIDISTSAIDPQALNLIPESVARTYAFFLRVRREDGYRVRSNERSGQFQPERLSRKKDEKRIVLALPTARHSAGISTSYTRGLSPKSRKRF